MAAALALAALVPAAAAAPLTAGPVAVEVATAPAGACTVGASGHCLVTHDPGASVLPGDDEVALTAEIERVSLRVAEGPDGTVVVAPAEAAVRHPAFVLLNGTWQHANASLPSAAHAVVTLESRPVNTPEGQWALLVVVHHPAEAAALTGKTFTSVPLSWDSSFYFSDHAGWDEASTQDTLRPLPAGLAAADGTDRLARWAAGFPTCGYLGGGLDRDAPALCGALAEAQPGLAAAADAWEALMPEVRHGARLDEVVAETGAEAAAGEAAAPAEGASRPGAREGASGATPGIPLAEAMRPPPIPADEERALRAASAAIPPHRVPEDPPGAPAAPPGPAAAALPALLIAGAVAGVLAAALYTRIARHRALEQATRRAVYEAIQAHPGIRVGTLARRLGRSYKTVARHVRVLQRAGFVEATPHGQPRLFARGRLAPGTDRRALVVASSGAAGSILRALEPGPAELRDLRAALGLGRSTASMALRRLEAAGLVRVAREGARVRVGLAGAAPAPPARALPPAVAAPA